MLGVTIARKVVRLRAARSRRPLHNYDHSNPLPSAAPAPSLLNLDPLQPLPTAQQFPLYKPRFQPLPLPIPREEQIPLTKETLDSLPSDQYLSKELKVRLTKKSVQYLPELDESALKAFYKDLVKSGSKINDEGYKRLSAPDERERPRKITMSKEEREEVLSELERRLLGRENELETEKSRLQELELGLTYNPNHPKHHRLLTTLAALAIPPPPSPGPSGTNKLPGHVDSQLERRGTVDVPLGLASSKEWDALFDEFLGRGDARGAETLLDVMRVHGVAAEDRVVDIMRADAEAGRVDDVVRLNMEIAQNGSPLVPEHQDLVVLSLLRHFPSQPQHAISHLLANEELGHPLPESSYRLVISHLTEPSSLTQSNAQTRAMAWDLFTHMRLAAHPTPSKEMYTTMIRACGESAQPQPERARDLWIEMTETEKLEPARDEYGAIIRALGSTKKDYLEAFELMRQMLAKHHDATFVPFSEPDQQIPRFSEYVPTLETFTALLEGTKRAGDLNRARWVLTEVVKLARTGQMLRSEEWNKGVDEDLLAGVFMTYAAWKPVIGRRTLKITDEKSGPDELVEQLDQDAALANGVEATAVKEEDWLDLNVLEDLVETGSTSVQSTEAADTDLPTTPQSSADAIREATALFQRILHDVELAHRGQANVDTPFKDVRLTARLVNSYISVHLAHAPSLALAKETFDQTWKAVSAIGSVTPNGWTYLQIVEKCALGNRGGIKDTDRAIALAWGEETWTAYKSWSNNIKKDIEGISEESRRRRRRWLVGLGERQIERIYSSVIRLQALHGSTSTSLSLLEEFHTLYPPSDIIETYSPTPEIGFKIKLSTRTEIPESNVPPYLLFDDVRLLHQKLTREEDWNGVNKLAWITNRYQAALTKRRKFRYKGVGQNREKVRSRSQALKVSGQENHDYAQIEDEQEQGWENDQFVYENENEQGRERAQA